MAGCTTNDAPPAGALTADDLGAGEWSGPFDSLDDATSDRRLAFCSRGGVWDVPEPDAEAQASAAWEADGVVVWSLAERYTTQSDAADKRHAAELMEPCVGQAEGKDPAAFTFADDGTTILIEDRNEDAGTVWVREMAMTTADTTFVAVMVSYPADADPTVSAEDLLDRAVQAAADLPED